MPDSPSCSAVISFSSCSRGEALGSIRYWMLGRSKLETKCFGVLHPQTLGELTVGGLGGRRGQRDPRDAREGVGQHRQPHVVGAEVVAPLGDAVRLVDRDEGEPGTLQQVDGAGEHKTLRRHIKQIDLAGQQLLLDGLGLVPLERGVEVGRTDSDGLERGDLIGHERDQRGDDHARAAAQQRGDLIAQRLAAAGGHQHHGVPAAGDLLDDLGLLAAERVVPEDGREDLECGIRLLGIALAEGGDRVGGARRIHGGHCIRRQGRVGTGRDRCGRRPVVSCRRTPGPGRRRRSRSRARRPSAGARHPRRWLR